jgi:hypothetical protein
LRALLNALGVTLWGLIAITLAVCLATLGYRASLQYRDSRVIGHASPRADPGKAAAVSVPVGTQAALQTANEPVSGANARTSSRAAGTIHDLFHRAVANQQYAEAVGYGEELYATGSATIDEFALMGRNYYLHHDCRNAVTWIDRAIIASRAVGEAPSEEMYQLQRQCASNTVNTARVTTGVTALIPPINQRKGQEISRVIAKEMTEAQKDLQKGQWADALKNLEAAEAKSPLTAFDKKTIYQFKGFANVKLNNLKAAQPEFEKALATGAATPEETASITRTLFGIAASTNQFQKTIDYGKTMVDAGTASPNDIAIIAQSYYQMKDCKNSALWSDQAIAATRKAGEAPKENLYLFKLQCASDAGDNAAMDAVLGDLIRLTNKTSYWNTLLRIERQDEREDHNTLMIYRIMYNTNSMNADTDYIEMAQLLADAALPGEAAAVLGKAMTTGIIKDEHKERVNRLLDSLESRADADRKGLAQEEAEANKSAAAELDVKLGEVYYGFGDYQRVVDAIDRGLQKGLTNHLDEAYVYLGLAEIQLKNGAEAKRASANLQFVPNVSPRVRRLWQLYVDTLGTPPVSSSVPSIVSN